MHIVAAGVGSFRMNGTSIGALVNLLPQFVDRVMSAPQR